MIAYDCIELVNGEVVRPPKCFHISRNGFRMKLAGANAGSDDQRKGVLLTRAVHRPHVFIADSQIGPQRTWLGIMAFLSDDKNVKRSLTNERQTLPPECELVFRSRGLH